jgi:hypothetical protein
MAVGSFLIHARSESLRSAVKGAVWGMFLSLGPFLPRDSPRPGKS